MNVLVETVTYSVRCEFGKHHKHSNTSLAEYKVSGLGEHYTDDAFLKPACNRVYHCCARHLSFFVSTVCKDEVSMNLDEFLAKA